MSPQKPGETGPMDEARIVPEDRAATAQPLWGIFVAEPACCGAARDRDHEEARLDSPAARALTPPLVACDRPEECRCQVFPTRCDLARLEMATFQAGRPCACAAAAELDNRSVPYRSRDHANWSLPLAQCNAPSQCTCDIVYTAEQVDEADQTLPVRHRSKGISDFL